MNKVLLQHKKYSTTQMLTTNKPEIIISPNDKFISYLFLPENINRLGEGGLRTKGYFKKSLDGKPLITVVTVVFNGEEYLEETILSVINQTYDNVEYIIIDGGSNDGTLDIIKKYNHAIDYWASEKDSGIYDAWNKAVSISRGEWISFVGSDDYWDSLSSIYEYIKVILNNADCNFISSKINLISPKKKHIRTIGSYFSKTIFIRKFNIGHPGSMHSMYLFKLNGLFDTLYKSSADYEFLLRSSGDINAFFIDLVTINMREGGISNSLVFKVAHKSFKETLFIQKKYSIYYAYKNYFLSIAYFYLDNYLKLKKYRNFIFSIFK